MVQLEWNLFIKLKFTDYIIIIVDCGYPQVIFDHFARGSDSDGKLSETLFTIDIHRLVTNTLIREF
jgi:hypothetical protein